MSFRRRYVDTAAIVLKVSVARSANDVFEPDALILAPHLSQPISNISAHDERVTGYFAILGFIGDKRAVAPLIKMLKDDIINLRFGAAQALGKIGEREAEIGRAHV